QTEINTAPTWLTALLSFCIVWLSVILLSWYKQFTSRKKTLLNVLLYTSLVRGMIIACWLSLIVWVTFILFSRYNYSISLVFGLSAIAFIYVGESLYDTIKDIVLFKKKKS
ncbi:MAG: hypothetical protein K2G76_03230, partial [Prevotella sp.]|nr:hypothetical protein [Prevotella sp.]